MNEEQVSNQPSAIIIAHNYPGGSLRPGKEDIEITGQLKSVRETLSIRLLDHIIFNPKNADIAQPDN